MYRLIMFMLQFGFLFVSQKVISQIQFLFNLVIWFRDSTAHRTRPLFSFPIYCYHFLHAQ